ncbi:unnamed protein product, partial [Didymodactylos carnosus]
GSKFECITDHSALQWLFDFNGHNKCSLSWSLSVQNYRDTMKIVHKPGKKHNNVDPLSRNPLPVNQQPFGQLQSLTVPKGR